MAAPSRIVWRDSRGYSQGLSSGARANCGCNGSADSMEAGDTLLIPALDPVIPSRARTLAKANASPRPVSAGPRSVQPFNIGATGRACQRLPRVPAQALHRKAAIRTAGLHR